ncbi:MAG: SsrA-binding protein SmpB, partial [Patescibacteria group bacterium]|nr:SsrA-binding protein SmpB [Patescibacteria group bacterium]
MKRVINRKARFKYELLDRVEAGVVLTGAEVKSVREGKISLGESFARIDDKGEAWLVNANIHPYAPANNKNYDPTRSRKLLLKRVEIERILAKIDNKNLTLVPTTAYSKGGRIKIELAIGKGKKEWDKRRTIKDREAKRELKKMA